MPPVICYGEYRNYIQLNYCGSDRNLIILRDLTGHRVTCSAIPTIQRFYYAIYNL